MRLATTADDNPIENALGKWFRGPLVDYHTGFADIRVRNILMSHEWGGDVKLAISGRWIKDNINYARDGGARGFDSGRDA
jgi:hypothetical protein